MLRVSLLGNMGADPELRYTAKGTQIASIRVAVNQVRTGPDGERQENTEWFRVRVSGPRADFVQRLSKGNRVLVIGRLDIGHYQSREGDTRTSFDVWADEVQLIGSAAAAGRRRARPGRRRRGGAATRGRGQWQRRPRPRRAGSGGNRVTCTSGPGGSAVLTAIRSSEMGNNPRDGRR